MVWCYGITLVVRVSLCLSAHPSTIHSSVCLFFVVVFLFFVVVVFCCFFSFVDDNLSKCQWIFTKLGMCTNVLEIWFGIAKAQI